MTSKMTVYPDANAQAGSFRQVKDGPLFAGWWMPDGSISSVSAHAILEAAPDPADPLTYPKVHIAWIAQPVSDQAAEIGMRLDYQLMRLNQPLEEPNWLTGHEAQVQVPAGPVTQLQQLNFDLDLSGMAAPNGNFIALKLIREGSSDSFAGPIFVWDFAIASPSA